MNRHQRVHHRSLQLCVGDCDLHKHCWVVHLCLQHRVFWQWSHLHRCVSPPSLYFELLLLMFLWLCDELILFFFLFCRYQRVYRRNSQLRHGWVLDMHQHCWILHVCLQRRIFRKWSHLLWLIIPLSSTDFYFLFIYLFC